MTGSTLAPAPTLELWQAEWCPHSHRVRERLTELGLDYLARQVPADREQRTALRAVTGGPDSIPVLVAEGRAITGADAILAHLDRYGEPPGASAHRSRAAELAPINDPKER